MLRHIPIKQMPNLTTKVVTLWYRAPELLYGNPNYGTEVDMWSLGCIIVELIQGRPLFPASNEVELLGMIYNLMGTPSPSAFERMKAPSSTMVCPDYKPSQFAVSTVSLFLSFFRSCLLPCPFYAFFRINIEQSWVLHMTWYSVCW